MNKWRRIHYVALLVFTLIVASAGFGIGRQSVKNSRAALSSKAARYVELMNAGKIRIGMTKEKIKNILGDDFQAEDVNYVLYVDLENRRTGSDDEQKSDKGWSFWCYFNETGRVNDFCLRWSEGK